MSHSSTPTLPVWLRAAMRKIKRRRKTGDVDAQIDALQARADRLLADVRATAALADRQWPR